jgi:hypothetical protein
MKVPARKKTKRHIWPKNCVLATFTQSSCKELLLLYIAQTLK